MLEQHAHVRPREYVLERTGRQASLTQLKRALRDACIRANQPYRFDDIDWDGRSERFLWGEEALISLREVVSTCRRQRASRASLALCVGK